MKYIWSRIRTTHLWLCLMMLSLLLLGCSEELALSASDQPTPSVDTLKMGVLLAGNSSRTYELKLYNHCKEELRLSSIRLREGDVSGFRMNIDGMNGSVFDYADLLRIAQGDSLFIFVEATFEKDGQGLQLHEDHIDISCNGVTQSIVLQAESKDVLTLQAPVVRSDTEWPRTTEVQIFDSLVIEEGVTLTLADSVTLYLHDKADIIVRGTLLSKGLPGAPVTIRGDRTDKMFDNLPYDNLPSQWGSLYIERQARDCVFEHTDIHGMAKGIFIDSTQVRFADCRIKNSDGNLLTCHMTELLLHNSELSNAAGSLLEAFGGWYDVVHCTLANYNFAARITQEAVHLVNIDTTLMWVTPLHRCNFVNTIIWGDGFDPDVYPEYHPIVTDITSSGLMTFADSVFTYRFDHCLLRAKGTDDNDFIQTIWDEDPLYQLIDYDNYSFDFHLQDASPAARAGSPEGASLCPLDLDGNPRDPATPSLGCYQSSSPNS